VSTLAISKTNAAGTSGLINLASNTSMQVFSDVGLGAGETVILERSYDSGSNWVRVVDANQRGVVLEDTIQSQIVNGPGDFRLVKSFTAIPTAVYYDT